MNIPSTDPSLAPFDKMALLTKLARPPHPETRKAADAGTSSGSEVIQKTDSLDLTPPAVEVKSDGSSVTVLHSADSMLAKTWQRDGKVRPYGGGWQFTQQAVPVRGIRGLSALLTKIEADPHRCIIRGRYVGDEAARKLEAEIPSNAPANLTFRRKSVFHDQPQHAMLIDSDKFKPITADAVREPVAAINEYILTSLPPAFHGAAFHWQLSNSAGREGNGDILKAHIWFWLGTPRTCTELKAWAIGAGLKDVVDTALFDEIQVHYTARPVFEDGVVDPVPMRSGFVDGRPEIDLDVTVLTVERKPSRAERVKDATHSDPRAQFLIDKGYFLGTVGAKGDLRIFCPFKDEHSSESGPTETVYYPQNTGGYASGHYKCLHGHCAERTDADYDAKIGYDIAGFDESAALADEPTEATPGEPAKSSAFRVIGAAEFMAREKQSWIIKKLMPKGELIVVFGESGSGKTFIVLDMAAAITSGREWRDRKVTQGRVIYICAEDSGGFRQRMDAYARQFAVPADQLPGVIAAAPNFLEKKDPIEVAAQIKSAGGADVIFIDTLAATMPGGDENGSEDMGKVVAHAKALHRLTGATVVFIHHSGKDTTKGARGHSSLRAAADAEFEVVRKDDLRSLRVSKQKNGLDGELFGFRLLPIAIGVDEDDEPITSCVVEHTEVAPRRVKPTKRRSTYEQFVVQAYEDLAISGDGALVESVIAAAVGKCIVPDGRDRRRDNVTRAIDALVAEGYFCKDGERLCCLQ